ncbi:MAG: Bax inhibitor-1/YccA family protein [Alphaproteobacteria bacterium]|nr:Bax inhibitor-1/YccA family protein [Alphaproteobacteria bacterium]
MQPDRFSQVSERAGVTYDAGLRAHFSRVYNAMAIGLALTGGISYGVASVPELFKMFNGSILGIVVMLAPLGIIFFGLTPAKMHRMSTGAVAGLYYLLTALFGISLSYIFMVYSSESIARVFFITAGMFAATSIYGYTTKKDLSGMGSLMFMGLIGIIIASLVNIFLQSTMVQFVTSVIGVIVFTGLTAWDTQRIKETYREANGAEGNAKLAIMGALSLYLNFINLFMMMLRLMGSQRQ